MKIGSMTIADQNNRIPMMGPRERVSFTRTLRDGLKRFVGLPSSRARRDSSDPSIYTEVDAWIKRIENAVKSIENLAQVAEMPGWIEWRDAELKRLDEQLRQFPDMGFAWMFKGDPRMLMAGIEDKLMREMFRVFDDAAVELQAARMRQAAELKKVEEYANSVKQQAA